MDRTFVDEARIHVTGGDGGAGSASFQREPYRPKGRPEGGNGGAGGSVILRVDVNVSTFSELAANPHQRATRGGNGSGNNKFGGNGTDRVLLVPDGTVVRDERGEIIADLVGDGSEFVAARGGRGGRGNAALANDRRRAPAFAERGEPGESRWLRLELKTIADVGLVGFPNAGKSSLIARLSAARPKVAAYPFTTLSPNLGVAETADGRFGVADVPGLIEGASEGRGLGLAFLRHLERCKVLCFVLDASSDDEPPRQLDALRGELHAYMESFSERPAVIALNKIDVTRDHIAATEEAARALRAPMVAVSALSGEGVEAVASALAAAVHASAEPVLSHTLVRLRPAGDEVSVAREDHAWRVRSERAERVLQRFDTSNDEALAYIQEKLISYGVEDALARAGARAGDEVRIGDHALEYTPESEAHG
ncbi:MAG: GTPase ObgE [Actinomycetota bacterium]